MGNVFLKRIKYCSTLFVDDIDGLVDHQSSWNGVLQNKTGPKICQFTQFPKFY